MRSDGKGKRVAKVKVHTGTVTYTSGKEEPVAWLNLTIPVQPQVHDLVDGLGSRYYRYREIPDAERPGDRPHELPEYLTPRQILDIYRSELKHWGTANLATWGEWPSLSFDEQESARKWLAELVVSAFPEMGRYVR